MRPYKAYKAYKRGILKDSFIIILSFASLYFIDIRLATFIAVICATILFTRRTVLYYNPGFIKGYYIFYNGKEVVVPNGVDIFDISKVPSMQHLYNYIEVIRGILVPPAILVIRFRGKMQLKEYERDLLKKGLHQLKKSNISVILTDVEENVRHQFRVNEIENDVGIENIFFSIKDALSYAYKVLNKKSVN